MQYHDIKEKMAWLASSLYAAFSLAFIKWMYSNNVYRFSTVTQLLILVFSVIIFICAFMTNINKKESKKNKLGSTEGPINVLICMFFISQIVFIFFRLK